MHCYSPNYWRGLKFVVKNKSKHKQSLKNTGMSGIPSSKMHITMFSAAWKLLWKGP